MLEDEETDESGNYYPNKPVANSLQSREGTGNIPCIVNSVKMQSCAICFPETITFETTYWKRRHVSFLRGLFSLERNGQSIVARPKVIYSIVWAIQTITMILFKIMEDNSNIYQSHS